MVDHVIDVVVVGITLVLSQAVNVFVSAKCLSVSKHILLYICIGQNSKVACELSLMFIVRSYYLFSFF
jgi:hypothetical protein